MSFESHNSGNPTFEECCCIVLCWCLRASQRVGSTCERVRGWNDEWDWGCECHRCKYTCEWVRKKKGEWVMRVSQRVEVHVWMSEKEDGGRGEWERKKKVRLRASQGKSGWCVFVYVCCCFPRILPIFLYSYPRGVQHTLWTIVEWCELKTLNHSGV